MYVLREVLEQAQKNRVAIGHFNISDSVQLKAVFTAAQELKVPVLIGRVSPSPKRLDIRV